MKTSCALKVSLLTLLLFGSAVHARAQGTISLANGISWYPGSIPIPVTIGLFWGSDANDIRLALPEISVPILPGGVFLVPSIVAIPGTQAGQTVHLQIRVWDASYGTNWIDVRSSFGIYAETDVRQVTLGQTAGPGATIWQISSIANPNRFTRLVLGRPHTPPAIVEVGVASFYNLTVDEGNQGTVDAVVTVSRTSTSFPPTTNSLDFASSVMLSTSNITAVAGVDYIPTNVVVSFGPGETFRLVRIKIIADADSEPNESFAVYLSSTGSFVGINQQPLTVTIREARLFSVRHETGQSIVSLRTTRSQHYTVEYTTNLVNWIGLPGAFDVAGNGGVVEVTDPEVDCCGNRFYRARLLP